MHSVHCNKTIVVTDGEERAALAIVRSLGKAGYRVIVCSHRPEPLAGASRWADSTFQVPDPLKSPSSYAEAVLSLCSSLHPVALLPVGEPSLLALLGRRSDLPNGVLLPFPDELTFRSISNKSLLLSQAAELGLKVPTQVVVPTSEEMVDQEVLSEIGFPVVIKPARSVGESASERQKLRVEYATTVDSLRHKLKNMPPTAFPVLIQQRIVGPGVGIFLMIWNGTVQAQFAHRRIREKPPSGGVSVYRESVEPDPRLIDASRRLLEAFGWQGVAMIEYKVDEATGDPYLMEVNGRFWGSLQLAIDAGVDFPRRLMEAANGVQTSEPAGYRTGVRSRWWWGDVDHLLLRLRHNYSEGSLPDDAPGLARAIIDFFILWRPGDRSEVFRWDDPRPFLRETKAWFRGS